MTEIKVRYRNGVFEPVEAVDLPDGTQGKVVELEEPTFFDLCREISDRVAASGVTDEEIERDIQEACEAARQQTWEALKRGEKPGTVEDIINQAVEAVRRAQDPSGEAA